MARHPALLIFWTIVSGFLVLALAYSSILILIPILVSPILTIATLAVVGRRKTEMLQRAWRIPYYGMAAALAAAGLIGVLASAARLVTDDQGLHFENAPIALLFLLAFLLACRAITKPSPLRAALPGMILHVSWIPLVILNLFSGARSYYGNHRVEEMFWSAVAILACSALTSILALLAFAEPDPIAVPEARAV